MAEIREISVEIDVRSVRKTFSYRLTPRSKKRRKKKLVKEKQKRKKRKCIDDTSRGRNKHTSGGSRDLDAFLIPGD